MLQKNVLFQKRVKLKRKEGREKRRREEWRERGRDMGSRERGKHRWARWGRAGPQPLSGWKIHRPGSGRRGFRGKIQLTY